MPDIPNFIRKHVFNFRPANVVLLIRMSIFMFVEEKEGWKLYFF